MKKIFNLLPLFILINSSNSWAASAASTSAANHLDESLKRIVQQFDLAPVRPPRRSSEEMIKLGEELFFTNELSGEGTISCAVCHNPKLGGGDGLPFALGAGARGKDLQRVGNASQYVRRHTPHLFNLHIETESLFWDGRLTKSHENFGLVAELISSPVSNPVEMRGTSISPPMRLETSVYLRRLFKNLLSGNHSSKWRSLFSDAFHRPIETLTFQNLSSAIEAYLFEAFYAGNSAYDNYLRGDREALTLAEKKGMKVFFNSARCGSCHSGENLGSNEYFNIGVPPLYLPSLKSSFIDYGRFEVTEQPADKFRFKTPGLRNVAITSPYMHNGAFLKLSEVIDHYREVSYSLDIYRPPDDFFQNYGEPISINSKLSPEIKNHLTHGGLKQGLMLSFTERQNLEEFLNALTDLNFRAKFDQMKRAK